MTDERARYVEVTFEASGPQRRVTQRPEEVTVDVGETDLKSSRPRNASSEGLS